VKNGRPAPELIYCAMDRGGVTDPATVAAVGDTALDLEAGNNAGVGWNVGVLSGGMTARASSAWLTRICFHPSPSSRAPSSTGGAARLTSSRRSQARLHGP
jgi:phosphoglycolate phosphatase-like HAD superfamily hydrolase